ncbi:MAG: C39 family peptidase [Candidatus Margulisbacteria bacterium]|nr:C39 family peptidase [Candidatus Margulisiibacteriota bacterium]
MRISRLIIISILLLALAPSFVEGPYAFTHNVPFLCQAPFGKWDQPWQDACEEAAIVMGMRFADGKQITKETGSWEMMQLIRYQRKEYGGHNNLTAERTASLIKEYYGFPGFEVVYDFGIEDMKQQLSDGKILLAPAAGRLLGNRYYTQPGPLYHFLVFTGYDDKKGEFITNDPGTKRGEGFRYKYERAYNAISDWQTGRKAMIVIKKL